MSSLREDLGLRPDPEFDLELPPGWRRRPADDEVRDELLAGIKDRLMQAHNPRLYAEVKLVLEESFDSMRREGAFAFFAATDLDPGTLFLPASIVASVRTAEPGRTLDDLVRVLVRQEGAAPLRGDVRIMRFEKERVVRVGGDSVVNHSVTYLTPVPGSGRRRALQLTAGFGRAPQTPADDPVVAATRSLFDSCVSTLRWRSPGDGA